MLKWLAFRGIFYNLACYIWRGFETDRSLHVNKPHSAVEEEAKQLLEYHVVLLWKERADKFSAVRPRGAEVLDAQIVLLLTGDLKLDGYYLRG